MSFAIVNLRNACSISSANALLLKVIGPLPDSKLQSLFKASFALVIQRVKNSYFPILECNLFIFFVSFLFLDSHITLLEKDGERGRIYVVATRNESYHTHISLLLHPVCEPATRFQLVMTGYDWVLPPGGQVSPPFLLLLHLANSPSGSVDLRL